MKIETLTKGGQTIEGAECRLSNDKSESLVQSGQSTSVRRSAANLSIDCTQAGYPPASGQAISRVNPGMVGNILIGGAIGAAIDASSGAGFNYPSWIQLVFGEVRSFDRSSQQGDLPLAGIHLGTTAEVAATGKTPDATAVARAPTPTPAPEPRSPEEAKGSPPGGAAGPRPAPAEATPSARVSMDDLNALLPAKQ